MTQSDLIQEWRKAGYKDRMGSCTIVPPPGAGIVRAYTMVGSNFAEANLSAHQLKVSRFADVNDPFELLGVNCRNHIMRKLTKQHSETLNRTTGLLCFTSDWSNPVMWSHYAERHKGLCLGFDLNRKITEPVKYSDDRLLANFSDDDDEEPAEIPLEIQEQLSKTKASAWAYEEETRVFVKLDDARPVGELYFRPYDDGDLELKEVILGHRCGLKLQDVKRLVAMTDPDAVVFKARLAFRSFRIVLDERTRPDSSPKH